MATKRKTSTKKPAEAPETVPLGRFTFTRGVSIQIAGKWLKGGPHTLDAATCKRLEEQGHGTAE